MGRRSDHSRKELEELALSAAIQGVTAQGTQGLTIRGVAHAIGYSPGTLYNLFENRDELILRVAGRALDLLLQTLEDAEAKDKAIGLHGLCDQFIRFVETNGLLWEAVIAARAQRSDPAIWYWQKVMRIVEVNQRVLLRALPDLPAAVAMRRAITMALALNGLVATVDRQNLWTFAQSDLASMAHDLIDRYTAGLAAVGDGSQRPGQTQPGEQSQSHGTSAADAAHAVTTATDGPGDQ